MARLRTPSSVAATIRREVHGHITNYHVPRTTGWSLGRRCGVQWDGKAVGAPAPSPHPTLPAAPLSSPRSAPAAAPGLRVSMVTRLCKRIYADCLSLCMRSIYLPPPFQTALELSSPLHPPPLSPLLLLLLSDFTVPTPTSRKQPDAKSVPSTQ